MRINPIQSYYIDNHLDMSDNELAKTTGLKVSQIKARRRKVQGLNREGNLKGEPENINAPTPMSPERVNQLQKETAAKQAAAGLPPPDGPSKPSDGIRVDALLVKKNGTVSLTQGASEAVDIIAGTAPKEFLPKEMQDNNSQSLPPQYDPSKVCRIKE